MVQNITAEELHNKLHNGGGFTLVDVLPKESFDSKHIPESINIPVGEIEERASKELPNKNKEVVVYCSSTDCQASPTAARKLEAMGYKNVKDFEAGLSGWQDAGFRFEGSAS